MSVTSLLSHETLGEKTMASPNQFSQGLLSERQVARITGMSVATVRRWRLLGQGPKYLKLNAAVRYRPEDVAAWLESRPSGGEANVVRLADSRGGDVGSRGARK